MTALLSAAQPTAARFATKRPAIPVTMENRPDAVAYIWSNRAALTAMGSCDVFFGDTAPETPEIISLHFDRLAPVGSDNGLLTAIELLACHIEREVFGFPSSFSVVTECAEASDLRTGFRLKTHAKH